MTPRSCEICGQSPARSQRLNRETAQPTDTDLFRLVLFTFAQPIGAVHDVDKVSKTMNSRMPVQDYEALTVAELEAAAGAATSAERRAHLDRAAVLATLGEKSRWVAPPRR